MTVKVSEGNSVTNGLVANEEELTPARAQELLDAAKRHPEIPQRKTNDKKIARYVRDMRKGDWGLADSIIALVRADNGDEVPTNGIHRLTACTISGCTIHVLVAHDTDIRDRRCYDRGFERTVKQQLTMEYGVENASPKVAALRALMLLANPGDRNDLSDAEIHYKISRPVFEKAFDDLLDIRNGCRTPSEDKRAIRSDIALAAFMFAYPSDSEGTKRAYNNYLRLQVMASGPTQPLHRIAEFARTKSATVNISSGAGRLPFLQKAIVLVSEALRGKECKKQLDLNQKETAEAVKAAVAKFRVSWDVVLTPDQQIADLKAPPAPPAASGVDRIADGVLRRQSTNTATAATA